MSLCEKFFVILPRINRNEKNEMDNRKLIDQLSERLGRNKTDVRKLMDDFVGVVSTRCGELDTIAIPGFGNFEPKKRTERIVVNPATGKRMLVPPKMTLGFKVSNVLKGKLKK